MKEAVVGLITTIRLPLVWTISTGGGCQDSNISKLYPRLHGDFPVVSNMGKLSPF